MKAFIRILNGLEKVLNALLAVSLTSMVVLLAYQTIMRYVFKSAPTWCEELCTYIFCYNTLLGASIAVRNNKHLQVDFLTSRYSEKAQEITGIIVSLVMIVFFVIFIKYSIGLMQYATGKSVTMPFIIMKYIYFAFPLGGVLIVVFAIEDIIKRVLRLYGKDHTDGDEEVIKA